jgi:phenylacetate-CoA ligase
MKDSPYWNPRHETMPREDLTRLQVRKLRRMMIWAGEHVPFHRNRFREAGVTPDSITSLEDLRRIPILTRDEWMQGQLEHPPYGVLLAAPPERAIRLHTTSGTSGRVPIRGLDGVKDWEWVSEMWAYGLWGFGVRPRDTVFFAFGYAGAVAFWGGHYAAEKIGCLVLAGGSMTTEMRLRQIMDNRVTVVCSTPTYALRLQREAEVLGIDLARGPVERVILSGEPGGLVPSTRRLVEEAWGAKVGDVAGMTEVGTMMFFECEHQPGGFHIVEDNFIEEVVDPETLEPVGYGERGERIATSLGRGFIPVLRYRTGDRVV